MIEVVTPNTNPVVRPPVHITPEQVRELKDRGASWREIAKTLGIGTATAMRPFRSIDGAVPIFKMCFPKHQKRSSRAFDRLCNRELPTSDRVANFLRANLWHRSKVRAGLMIGNGALSVALGHHI